MIEPCTVEQLEASCATLREMAVAAGRQLKLAQINGAKMRQIRGLESAHAAAWGRYYAVDNRLHEARHRNGQ